MSFCSFWGALLNQLDYVQERRRAAHVGGATIGRQNCRFPNQVSDDIAAGIDVINKEGEKIHDLHAFSATGTIRPVVMGD
jgi:hypothetical protein